MKVPDEVVDADSYQLHPGLIDSCFQPFFLTVAAEEDVTFVPFRVGQFSFYKHPREVRELWCLVVIKESDDERLLADSHLFDENGIPVAAASGLELRRASRRALLRGLQRDYKDWLCQIHWEPCVDLQQRESAVAPTFVFADGGGTGARIVERLRARGEHCVVVERGESFAEIGADHYEVNPYRTEEFTRVFAGSTGHNGAGWRGGTIVYLWGLDTELEQLKGEGGLEAAQMLNGGAALHLVQALGECSTEFPPRLLFATCGAQSLPGADHVVQIQQGLLWGLGVTIAREYPEWDNALVDLDPDQRADGADQLLDVLGSSRGEQRLAYRNGTAHGARLQRAPAPVLDQPFAVRAEGTYLVAGGLGGLGLEVAGWLVERGAAHVLLVGRSAPSAETRAAVDTLQKEGVQVGTREADLSDWSAVEKVLSAITASGYPLCGIVQAAGVLDDGLLRGQDAERLARVLAPKVSATWNLHEQTRDMELDLFVCFSSSTALLGASGQGAYAAANAFMDALMRERRRMGLHGLSINWGPWGEVGMAAELARRDRERFEEQGWSTIAPVQGLSILEHFVAADAAQVAVLPIDWPVYFERVSGSVEDPFYAALALELVERKRAAPVRAVALDEIVALPAARQRDGLLKYVRAQIVHVARLGDSDIQPRQRFFDLGLDSLMAVELRDSLQMGLGHALPATVVFDYPTLEALVDYLSGVLLGEATEPESAPDIRSAQRVETMSTSAIDALDADEIAELLDAKLDELKL